MRNDLRRSRASGPGESVHVVRAAPALIVLTAFALSQDVAAQPPPAKPPVSPVELSPVAEGKATLELTDVPAGAAVLLDGKEVGGERRFAFDLRPGQMRLLTVSVRFAPGREAEQRVLLKPGWRVRYAPRAGAEGRPELVLQTGHRTTERAFLSPDGRLLLTGGYHDPVALVWDARTGTVLRQFPGKKALTPAGFGGGGQLVVAHDRDAVYVWEVQTGKLLHSFSQQGLSINAVAVGRDGQRVLAGGYAETRGDDVRGALWEIAGGRQVQTFRGSDYYASSVDLSPDGTLAAFGGNQAVLLNTRTGKVEKRLEFTNTKTKSYLPGVAFSPDGKRLVAVNGGNELIVWEVASGTEKLRFKGHERTAFHQHVSWSADGRHILSGGGWNEHGEISVWDAAAGKKVRDLGVENVVQGLIGGKARPTFRGHSWGVNHSSFSPDGKYVVSSGGSTAVIWEVETGKRVRTFQGHVGQVNSVAVSPDGRRLLVTRSSGGGADTRQWHLGEGRPKESFPSPQWATSRVAFHPRQPDVLVLGSESTDFASGRVLLCDPATAKVRQSARWPVGLQGDIYYLGDFSPDGKEIATASAVAPPNVRDPAKKGIAGANQINVWDAHTGERLRTFEDVGGSIRSLAYSPDGRRLLTAQGPYAVVRDATTGAVVRRMEFPKEEQRSAAYHPNGRTVAVGSDEGVVRVRDMPPEHAATGPRPVPDREVKAHVGATTWLGFTPDGTHLLSTGWDHTACLWEVATGRLVHRFRGHSDAIFCAALAADGRHLLTGSRDGTARWWDLATGEELACLIQLAGGKDWVVTTPDGLFDGSARGREQVAYRVGGGLNVVPVDRFFQDFYRPGLLSALTRGEPVKAEVQIGKQAPPSVRIVSPKESGRVTANELTLEVEVTDEGGGVQGPWLFHNGARAVAQGKAERQGKVHRRTFAVTLLTGENRLEVKAASGDGSWESEPARLVLRYEKPPTRHRLFILAVGINRYAQSALDLRFAAPDAKALADLFTRRGKRLYADVHVTPLLDQQATKAAILRALDDIARKAQPPDTLLVFLAGHGTMVGQRYFFVPHDFRRAEGKSQEEDIRAQGLAVDVLGEAVSAVPALKRMLIFDTCQSGGAIAPRRTGRDPFAFRGEIERLSRAQGVFTLAAAAAGEEAQEVPELGHGVLTYTLLAGLRGVNRGPLETQWVRPSSSDRVADVLEWFSFASGHVPRLTQKYFGREQDVQMSSQGSSFPLLPVEDR